MRLYLFILQKYNLKSRSFAENLIKKGKVNVNNVTLKKPSYDVSDDDDVEVFQNDEFESLGGDKLQKAITEFNIDVENLECVDIGASNGGFTDCMLKHGAKVVYAVDVGQTQLNENLLKNKKVVVKDFLNARDITVSDVNGKKDFLTIDVSFISLKLVRSGEAASRSREKTRKKRNRRKSRRQNESRKRYSEFRAGTRIFGRGNNDRPRQLQKQKRRISSLFQKNRICIAPR